MTPGRDIELRKYRVYFYFIDIFNKGLKNYPDTFINR